MTDTIYRIVAGTDISETATVALEQAFDLAAREERAEVHVMHAIPYMGEYAQMDLPVASAFQLPLEEAREKLEAHVGACLAEWQRRTKKTFSRCVTHLSTELPATAVAQLATDLDAQMIVVATHGRRGIPRLFLGSVAEAVVRLAQVPVLVVRPKAEEVPLPKIEPPCPRCVETRKATGGEQFWCEQHREKHGRRHTYHFGERVSKDGSAGFMTGMPR